MILYFYKLEICDIGRDMYIRDVDEKAYKLQLGNGKNGESALLFLSSFILLSPIIYTWPCFLLAVWPIVPTGGFLPTVAASLWKPEWTESYIRGVWVCGAEQATTD